MLRSVCFPVRAQVVATRDFGPVVKGQVGVITRVVRAPRLFWRRLYICTFLGDISAVALSSEIRRFSHGVAIDVLKDPLWFRSSGCWRQAYGAVPARRVLRLRDPTPHFTESSDGATRQDGSGQKRLPANRDER